AVVRFGVLVESSIIVHDAEALGGLRGCRVAETQEPLLHGQTLKQQRLGLHISADPVTAPAQARNQSRQLGVLTSLPLVAGDRTQGKRIRLRDDCLFLKECDGQFLHRVESILMTETQVVLPNLKSAAIVPDSIGVLSPCRGEPRNMFEGPRGMEIVEAE